MISVYRERAKMKNLKIAITASEPALYTDYEPVFEESPFLILIDEHGSVQKYAPELGQKGGAKGRADWIISRGAKILVTGSVDDAEYRRLRRAGVAIAWEVFGEVKDLVERARGQAEVLLKALEDARSAPGA